MAQLVKNLTTMQKTWLQPWVVGRSPGDGKGNPLQYSGLANSMDCIGHGVSKSQTRLNDFHFKAPLAVLSRSLDFMTNDPC